MSDHLSNLDLYLSQAFKGAEKGKKHLRTAAKEVLMAAKSISGALSSLSSDSEFHKSYPKLSQLLQFGISTVGEIIQRVQSEKELEKKRKKKTNGKVRKRKKSKNH